MRIELSDCIHITPEEYVNLIDPQFEGQTRVDSEGNYYMVSSSNGKLYAVKYNIFS